MLAAFLVPAVLVLTARGDCAEDVTCGDGEECCGTECMPLNATCCGNSSKPEGGVCCEGIGCAAGEECCGRGCMPLGDQCCGDNISASPEGTCCMHNVGCNATEECCGLGCMPSGQQCCGDYWVGPFLKCCGNHVACNDVHECCGHGCMPLGAQCCGETYCPKDLGLECCGAGDSGCCPIGEVSGRWAFQAHPGRVPAAAVMPSASSEAPRVTDHGYTISLAALVLCSVPIAVAMAVITRVAGWPCRWRISSSMRESLL